MIGFEPQTTERAPIDEGIEHIPLKFDLDIEDWNEIKRADLVFEDVVTVGPSFMVYVFFNNKKADADTVRTAGNGYAGRFLVFGHGDCIGAEGHCGSHAQIVQRGGMSAIASREHPTKPQKKLLTVTNALDRVMRRYAKGLHTITLITQNHAPIRADRRLQSGLLKCKRVSLRTYS